MYIKYNKLPSTPLTKKTFFNLSSFPELSQYSDLFHKGLKYIPNPPDISNQELDTSFNNFYNSTLWKKHFYELNRASELNNDEPDNFEDEEYSKTLLKVKKKVRSCPFASESRIGFSSLITTLNNMKDDLQKYKHKNPVTFKYSKEVKMVRELKKKYPSVIFKPADKNIGIVAMDIHKYNDLVLAHLNDTSTYKLESNTFARNHIIQRRCLILYKEFLGTPLHAGPFALSNSEMNYLLQFKDFKVPYFYILPKLHKEGPLKGRPIAGAVNWITTPIAKILDFKLRNYVKQLEFSLKNSQELVDDIATTIRRDNSTIITADVESLYPNIVLEYLYEMFQNDPKICHLLPLVQFVCDNSYVQYNNNIYKQLKGIAMGTNCAVSLANIYMAKLIDNRIRKYMDPLNSKFCILGYKRYIDDLIFHCTGNTTNFYFVKMDISLSCLKLNYQLMNDNKAQFMDIEISTTLFDNKFHCAVYQKPLNKYNYLPPSSNHAPHTHKGFITGELTRYCRLSSDIHSYTIIKRLFYSRLIARGYKRSFLRPIFKKHKWLHRFNINKTSQPVLPFIIPYTNRINNEIVKKIFYKYRDDLLQSLPTFKPIFVYSTKSNLAANLIKADITAEQAKRLNTLT